MKRITAAMIGIAVLMLSGLTVFAADNTVTKELRQEADALDISLNAETCIDEAAALHAQGVRVFDTIDLLGEDEKNQLEELYSETAEETGFDIAVFTCDGYSGLSNADDYADYLFYEGCFGTGDEKSGSILVINMDEREAYIYTHGDAIRYMTDSQMDYIYDELDGGLYPMLGDGEYAEACAVFAEGVMDAYNNGIASDQANYNEETGEYDPYYDNGISLFDVLIALLISSVCGYLPVASVRRKYAMKSEKRMAEGFNNAYRAGAVFNYENGRGGARLINSFVTTAPIPVQRKDDHIGGSGHGGGISTVRGGRGGSVHGGSGRHF